MYNKYMKKEEKTKINALQAIRALAFLGIFSYHCSLTGLGSWGVSVFFMLSGFVLVYSYYERLPSLSVKPLSALRFSFHKLARLYPLYLIMLVLSIRFGQLLTYNRYELIRFGLKFLANVTMMQSWVPLSDFYYSFNTLSWYLSDMLFLYLIFPLILHFMHHYRHGRSAVFTILIVFSVQTFFAFFTRNMSPLPTSAYPFNHWVTYVFPLFRAGDFIIGCNLGYLFLRYRDLSFGKFATVVEGLALLQIPAFILFDNMYIAHAGTQWWSETLLMIPFSMFLIYTFACSSGRISSFLASCKPLLILADLSPYAYLIHFIAFREIFHHISGDMSRIPALCITIIIVFAISLSGAIVYKHFIYKLLHLSAS